MSNQKKAIFYYSEYKNFLKSLKRKGEIFKFNSLKKLSSGFILRHDIDYDLELALRLSEIEYKEKVSSTYFVLLTCQTYNVFSAKNKNYLKSILQMGHEIGLHFDPSVYKNYRKSFKSEINILSDLCETKIKSVSLHNPSINNKFPQFKGYINAYDPKYFSNDAYISDSRMHFRGKDIYKFIDKYDGTNLLQILLHPMHFSLKGDDYKKIILSGIKRTIENQHEQFKANNAYKDNVGSKFPKNLLKKIK